jgi:hypothetical protein
MNRIDLIIDALELCTWHDQQGYLTVQKALAAARELRALEHVAWMKGKELTWKPPFKGHTEGWIKLYALGESNE